MKVRNRRCAVVEPLLAAGLQSARNLPFEQLCTGDGSQPTMYAASPYCELSTRVLLPDALGFCRGIAQ